MDSEAVARFEASRSRLASLAYRLLGSAADAEDIVQDAFLRWQAADTDRIDVPEAWLTKVVTNLAIDRLRSAAVRRERAAGDWLPEPLLDGDPMLGPADTAEQRESVTLAVLTILERLTPTERAVYVLREAFGYSHIEIAAILEVTVAASQQHAHRAKRRVAAERTVTEVDRSTARRIVEAFVDAAASGRTERLVAMLTDDATGISDGAAVAGARLIRLNAPDRVASAFRAGFKPTAAKRRLVGGSPAVHAGLVNGAPAVIVAFEDRVIGVMVLEVRDGKVAIVRGMGQPRLGRVSEQWRRRPHGEPLIANW